MSSSPAKKQRTEAGQLGQTSRPQIAILDFGSQYSHLIARRVRELKVFCELYSCKVSAESLQPPNANVVGVILSGGPSSVYESDAPRLNPEIWEWLDQKKIPVLGICYGLCEMVVHYGGKVSASAKREYGLSEIKKPDGMSEPNQGELFFDVFSGHNDIMWMSHGDKIEEMPPGFSTLACTVNAPHASISGPVGTHRYGVQFHPEVTHSLRGKQLLKNFVLDICKAPDDWNMKLIADEFIKEVREKVGPIGHVIGGVSGGVDSSVAAVLMNKAIGKRFHAIMVDNGCLRLNEANLVRDRLRDIEGIDLHVVDASDRFLEKLAGVSDPERKRKIIGAEFIEVFQDEANRIKKSLKQDETVDWLLQGTLYPDVIESLSYKGPSATIKSHHNVGGLPEKMHLKLIEPLRELFKDEVRELGVALGLDKVSVMRHPFPGPGLAIRILGDITREKADKLRLADDIMIQEIRKAGVYDEISQAFVVLLPCKSVGVMGDGRTYDEVAAVRCVTTTDFMTADWYHMDPKLMTSISSRIINEVKGINRVVYDISSKPPATIEWE